MYNVDIPIVTIADNLDLYNGQYVSLVPWHPFHYILSCIQTQGSAYSGWFW